MKTHLIILAFAWVATLAAAYMIGSKSEHSDKTRESASDSKDNARSTSRYTYRERSSSANRSSKNGSGTSQSVTNSELRDIRELMRQTDPLSRNKELLAFIDRLGKEDFEQVIADFRSLGNVRDRMNEYSMLLYAWGKTDPMAALDYAEEHTGTPFARQTILTSWAADNPDAALSWAQQHHEGEGANPWLVGVIRGIITSGDTTRATEIMQTLPLSRERGEALSSIVPTILKSGKEHARQWLNTITDERLRQGGASYLAMAMARNNPAEAAEWVTSLNDPQATERAASNVAGIWADSDLDAALAWTDSLPASSKARATQEIMPRYAQQDPEKAAAWLTTLSNQENYSRIVQGYIWSTARNHPEMALAQIPQVADERSRSRYYERILRNWQQRDAAAAETWLNNSDIPDSIRQRIQQSRQRRN